MKAKYEVNSLAESLKLLDWLGFLFKMCDLENNKNDKTKITITDSLLEKRGVGTYTVFIITLQSCTYFVSTHSSLSCCT